MPEEVFVGLDVSEAAVDAAVYEGATWRGDTSPTGIQQLVEKLVAIHPRLGRP